MNESSTPTPADPAGLTSSADAHNEAVAGAAPVPVSVQAPTFTPPAEGELIVSVATNNTYRIGKKIGEGAFGVVYECTDTWENVLAVKILKPLGTYEHVRDSAIGELVRLRTLRHPNVTYVHDAFEYRDTFYI